MSNSLEFRARDRHPFVYVGASFGAIFVATGASSVVLSGGAPSIIVVGLFALGFGGAILVSAAYAVWGRLSVAAGDDGWCTITWMLGPWSQTKRFPRADVRSVKRYIAPSFAIMWPSIAGRQLRVDVQRKAHPVDVGGGFELGDAELRSIEQLIGATR